MRTEVAIILSEAVLEKMDEYGIAEILGVNGPQSEYLPVTRDPNLRWIEEAIGENVQFNSKEDDKMLAEIEVCATIKNRRARRIAVTKFKKRWGITSKEE
jgi:hypothetical protein